MNITVSIIGSAGRNNIIYKLSKDIYGKMIKESKDIINEIKRVNSTNDIILVSGGAAFSDHIAVDLFLSKFVDKLTLHIPCDWDSENKEFFDIGKKNWIDNPGGTSNYYHTLFSTRFNKKSLEEIDTAITQGAIINSKNRGFHNRNNMVAKSDYVIVFSTGKNEPETGGTLYTWGKCMGEKIYICLYDL